ncbi:unnamed protein product [Gordionus sp. m RMFG-2023]
MFGRYVNFKPSPGTFIQVTEATSISSSSSEKWDKNETNQSFKRLSSNIPIPIVMNSNNNIEFINNNPDNNKQYRALIDKNKLIKTYKESRFMQRSESQNSVNRHKNGNIVSQHINELSQPTFSFGNIHNQYPHFDEHKISDVKSSKGGLMKATETSIQTSHHYKLDIDNDENNKINENNKNKCDNNKPTKTAQRTTKSQLIKISNTNYDLNLDKNFKNTTKNNFHHSRLPNKCNSNIDISSIRDHSGIVFRTAEISAHR